MEVNSKNLQWVPLLYRATEIGDIATMQFLISRGAHINVLVPNIPFYTGCGINHLAAFHVTANKVNKRAMACLVEAEADVNFRNGNGRTALFILCNARLMEW